MSKGTTIKYHKLVRDRIPEIIEASGKHCVSSILDENSFQVKLLEVNPQNNYSEVDYDTGEEELSLYTFEAK